MAYRRSEDGVQRTNVRFAIRLTREELREANAKAIACGYKSFRNFVEVQLGNMQMDLSERYDEASKFRDDEDGDLS